MKISKEQLVGFIIVAAFFVLLGFTVELPLFQFTSKKVTLFEAVAPIELFFICLVITCTYFLITYFTAPSKMLKNLKSLQEPLQKVYNTKFDYWLKSLLFEEEFNELTHSFNIETVKDRIESAKINVLMEAAKVNDMTITTYIHYLTAEADTKLKKAKSEIDVSKVEILKEAAKIIDKLPPIWQAYIICCLTDSHREFQNDMDIQRDISGFVKNLKEQEVKKAKAEAETFEQKMKKEQQKYTTNDKV